MTKSTIKVENVVANARFADKFDLPLIESKLDSAVYDKNKFPGLVYHLNQPKAAFLIFGTGKIVCTGVKSVDDVKVVINNVAEELRSMGIAVEKNPEFVIQNIVASADLGSELNLNAIAIGLGLENIEYEPEQFPGLVYRVEEPKIVVLIFGSGKLVVTGGKTLSDCEKGVEIVRRQIEGLGLL
ncbi:MAG: TATA-box-binding protein [Methanocellales archaeon]|nr:TATA-box-binding protein [Methanocellales archaeon]MDD3291775.1 TATA-box-binding protein [Methanocellales archaeon]MDD5235125.1 TATA-box-binding protein [Methanocellales archaeon]MDD5485263.1 TATA-box-binding protein [Methanocellales archaeon]